MVLTEWRPLSEPTIPDSPQGAGPEVPEREIDPATGSGVLWHAMMARKRPEESAPWNTFGAFKWTTVPTLDDLSTIIGMIAPFYCKVSNVSGKAIPDKFSAAQTPRECPGRAGKSWKEQEKQEVKLAFLKEVSQTPASILLTVAGW